ncbi:MAG: TolC family protein [Planctomycetota bacterium]|jgi:outer membrane protein TolC
MSPAANRKGFRRFWLIFGLLTIGGCQWFAEDADREVYRLLDRRQQQAVGTRHDVRIADNDTIASDLAGPKRHDPAYDFVPHPIDADVPESFQRTSTQPSSSTTQPTSAAANRKELSLADALAYAFEHSRDFQTAKEDLYVKALELTLERHMWTPRLMGEIDSLYANYGQIRNFDHAMDAIALIGVEQNLPYGGTVTAQVLNTLMRDLTHHITSGETGQILIEANIPLLRGAGKVAYESRYQAERKLIYAVRTFTRFRRSLAVDIAGDYFSLQQLRQEIVNAEQSIKSLTFERDRAYAKVIEQGGSKEKLTKLDVDRADQDRLVAENAKSISIEAYQTALDEFKISIGMSIETPIDVQYPEEPAKETVTNGKMQPSTLEEAIRMPDVTEKEAIRVALKYRLDLLNDLDAINDARRGVWIAKNNLLPNLDAFGSVQLDTNPAKLNTLSYNSERTTWRAGLNLELPLDRKEERNALRSAIISKRQSLRNYEQAKDFVRLQVRRAMRQLYQAQTSLGIQIAATKLASKRSDFVKERLMNPRKGETLNNRDFVEAEEDLLEARNQLAQAQAQLLLAILEFRRDTGTLRIDEEGKWAAQKNNRQGS